MTYFFNIFLMQIRIFINSSMVLCAFFWGRQVLSSLEDDAEIIWRFPPACARVHFGRFLDYARVYLEGIDADGVDCYLASRRFDLVVTSYLPRLETHRRLCRPGLVRPPEVSETGHQDDGMG